MLKRLHIRFMIYAMLVFSVVLFMIAGIFLAGTSREIPIQRLIVMFSAILLLVFVGSAIIAGLAMKPVKKAWQQQMDFTADASHELRTPLAVIRSNLEIVLDQPDKKTRDHEKWLRNIWVETERMGRLVEDLLTLASSQTGVDLSCEIPLHILAEDRISAYAALASQKQIQLENRVDESMILSGDPLRISQLFSILMDNAIKYMNRPGSLVISGYRKGKHICLEFRDNGEGMLEDALEKAFLRFYRGDKSRSHKQGGFGLGLSIARWIVEAHHGVITLDSAPGEGTCVRITF
jgi:signal transduction histidine kinase